MLWTFGVESQCWLIPVKLEEMFNFIYIFFQTVTVIYWGKKNIFAGHFLFIDDFLLTDSCVICYLNTQTGS